MKKFAETPFLPTEVEIEAISDNEAKISAYPFEDGFAITLAHPLRRLLLSSSVGYAPIAVKIEGASHEFDSLRGMLEDIAIFVINLKNIKFKINGDKEQVVVEYSFNGPREIRGEDLINSDVEVVSKDAHLATINSDCNLTFSVIIQKGIGYMPSEDIRDIVGADYIPIDAFFTPVKKVVYDIEKMLVEDNPNFEKAVFTSTSLISTNSPKNFSPALSKELKLLALKFKSSILTTSSLSSNGSSPLSLTAISDKSKTLLNTDICAYITLTASLKAVIGEICPFVCIVNTAFSKLGLS